jgi:hypothetical protein
MKLAAIKKHQFIPAFNGNRNLPSGEQIVVDHRPPTQELKRKLLRYDMKYVADKKGDYKVESVGMPDEKEVLEGMVLGFTGLVINYDEGEDLHIKTMKDLYAGPPELSPLIKEIYEYFVEILRGKEETAKN